MFWIVSGKRDKKLTKRKMEGLLVSVCYLFVRKNRVPEK